MAMTKVKLPSAGDFTDIEIPEFERKYVRLQGPASIKKSAAGRTFSAGGPKADMIAKIIFAERGYTRQQIATIVGCSPSRVTEVIWALEEAVKKGQIEGFPAVPRQYVDPSTVVEEPAAEENADA